MIDRLPYIIEILTPKKGDASPERSLRDVNRFGERYSRIHAAGCAVSIPDNPLGIPRLHALEAADRLGLAVDPERFIMNLNSYHSREGLEELLEASAGKGVRYLLVVRGDGSPGLPKLRPEDIGAGASVVTSIELLAYINRRYPGVFVTGCAYNQYKPAAVETAKLAKKIAAGAKFVITQPVIGRDPAIDGLLGVSGLGIHGPASDGPIPVIVEAWMSCKTDLLVKSVKGDDVRVPSPYDPMGNLGELHRAYPGKPVYLSMLDFSVEWERLLPRLG
jgi:methylenetetrahydrofolate reductase (NADPH)